MKLYLQVHSYTTTAPLCSFGITMYWDSFYKQAWVQVNMTTHLVYIVYLI